MKYNFKVGDRVKVTEKYHDHIVTEGYDLRGRIGVIQSYWHGPQVYRVEIPDCYNDYKKNFVWYLYESLIDLYQDQQISFVEDKEYLELFV